MNSVRAHMCTDSLELWRCRRKNVVQQKDMHGYSYSLIVVPYELQFVWSACMQHVTDDGEQVTSVT